MQLVRIEVCSRVGLDLNRTPPSWVDRYSLLERERCAIQGCRGSRPTRCWGDRWPCNNESSCHGGYSKRALSATIVGDKPDNVSHRKKPRSRHPGNVSAS